MNTTKKKQGGLIENPLFYAVMGVLMVVIANSGIINPSIEKLTERLVSYFPYLEMAGWILIMVASILFFIKRWNNRINDI